MPKEKQIEKNEKNNKGTRAKKYKPFRQQGLFMFPTLTLKFSMEERKAAQEMVDKYLLELMYMHQAYHDSLSRKVESQYALRGSKIKCSYGTKTALLDCTKDHGVLMESQPVLTCWDCGKSNIYNFGSCMCPEKLYMSKKVNGKPLPMTGAVFPDGREAKRAWMNRYAHICVPLMGREWLQEDTVLMIEDNDAAVQALVGTAVLTCQYGGMISIEEVPEIEDVLENFLVTLDHLDDFGFYIGSDDEERIKGVTVLNDMLKKYNITTNEEIAFFMGQVAKESRFGARTLESYSGNSPEQYFNTKYSNRNDLGNTGGNDGELYRGAGYIHLTGRYNYTRFANFVNDSSIIKEGYKKVGGNYNRDVSKIKSSDVGVIDIGEYAWESAAWFWTEGNPKNKNLNNFVTNLDWKSVSEAINQHDTKTFYERNQYINVFYEILTGKSLNLPIN